MCKAEEEGGWEREFGAHTAPTVSWTGPSSKRGGIESNWPRAADFNVLRRQGTGLLAHTHSRASIQQDRCVVTVCISHTLTGTNAHFLFTVVI